MNLSWLFLQIQEVHASATLTDALSAIDLTLDGAPAMTSNSAHDCLRQSHASHVGAVELSRQWAGPPSLDFGDPRSIRRRASFDAVLDACAESTCCRRRRLRRCWRGCPGGWSRS